MRVVQDPIDKNACHIQLTSEDVESAIRQFIVVCHPEFATGFVVNPVQKPQAAIFEAHNPNA